MKTFSTGRHLAARIFIAFLFGLLTLSATAQTVPSRDDVGVNVAVMDPHTVKDVFGKRIAERFVALQVTIRNKSSEHQFLIHDVSLDLEKVFPEGYFTQRDNLACQKRIAACNEKNKTLARADQVRCACEASEYTYELSSLELSLLRGVAEKGQGSDLRNKVFRFLQALGTIGGGLVGVAGFGPSYAGSIAVFNGPVLSAYNNALPDYTINQMNRLSDSAYQSNTLVPKEQAKVIVAFVSQAMFLTKAQKATLWKDPTKLFDDTTNPIDFRRTVAVVRGAFITEITNLPPLIVSAQFEEDELKKFQADKPVVKGFLAGRFSPDVRINLLNQEPEGLSIKLDGTPSNNRLRFIIESTQPVPPDTLLIFEVANDQAVQTTSRRIHYKQDAPIIESITPNEGVRDTDELEIEITGKNFTPGKTNVLVAGTGVRVLPNSVEVLEGGTNKLKAILVIAADAPPGERRITVSNPTGGSAAFVAFTVKAAP
jgi:hypothetical protein